MGETHTHIGPEKPSYLIFQADPPKASDRSPATFRGMVTVSQASIILGTVAVDLNRPKGYLFWGDEVSSWFLSHSKENSKNPIYTKYKQDRPQKSICMGFGYINSKNKSNHTHTHQQKPQNKRNLKYKHTSYFWE